MKEPILSREEVERAWDTSNGMVRRDNVSEDQLVAFAAALESAILEKLCGEPAGQAGTMPGTDGFTMAAFRADDVPVGTPLYTLKDRQS
ncbi:hypothetical protein [Burkholderia cepacia]|uniref:hypothetical protein n=1 Tax=Burkholderia cepacia TaxID=292 RepID=UPI001F1B9F75|nr:hypothetical protein [Burkholderia cepacia]UIY58160.1 hypothetical protein LZ568_08075 [Burkholderia cepacia]UIY60038.1 hypothetical protein LZ568_18550 [Burkholderia cepacia]